MSLPFLQQHRPVRVDRHVLCKHCLLQLSAQRIHLLRRVYHILAVQLVPLRELLLRIVVYVPCLQEFSEIEHRNEPPRIRKGHVATIPRLLHCLLVLLVIPLEFLKSLEIVDHHLGNLLLLELGLAAVVPLLLLLLLLAVLLFLRVPLIRINVGAVIIRIELADAGTDANSLHFLGECG